MSGFSIDGKVLDGWDHVRQSITTILSTRIGTRIMRRDFGSRIPDLIDRPMNDATLMAIFSATASALEPRQVGDRWYGERRFKLERVQVVSLNALGQVSLVVSGIYYPRGLEGDFSQTVADQTTDILFN